MTVFRAARTVAPTQMHLIILTKLVRLTGCLGRTGRSGTACSGRVTKPSDELWPSIFRVIGLLLSYLNVQQLGTKQSCAARHRYVTVTAPRLLGAVTVIHALGRYGTRQEEETGMAYRQRDEEDFTLTARYALRGSSSPLHLLSRRGLNRTKLARARTVNRERF